MKYNTKILSLIYEHIHKTVMNKYDFSFTIDSIIGISTYDKFDYNVYILVDGYYIMDIRIPNYLFELKNYIIFHDYRKVPYLKINKNELYNIVFLVTHFNKTHFNKTHFLYVNNLGKLKREIIFNFDKNFKEDYTNTNLKIIDEI